MEMKQIDKKKEEDTKLGPYERKSDAPGLEV